MYLPYQILKNCQIFVISISLLLIYSYHIFQNKHKYSTTSSFFFPNQHEKSISIYFPLNNLCGLPIAFLMHMQYK